mgnify:CR=1 FL=1
MTDVRVKNIGDVKCWVETNRLDPEDEVELTISNEEFLERLKDMEILEVEVISDGD